MASSPQGRLAGKRCVVTGAAQGIAWAVTQAFLREGAEVMAVDINKTKLEALPDLPGLSRRVLDVRDREGIMKLAQDYTGVNVLFNCAGYVHMGTIMDVSVDLWDKTFDVNVKAMLHFIQAFVPQMKEGGGGSVINMASVVSSLSGLRERGVYGTTKAAVVGLTKGLAAEEIRNGIRANVVCPGPVETDSFQERSSDAEDSDIARDDAALYPGVLGGPTRNLAVRARVLNKLMGRLPRAEDLTGLLVYLASDESWNHTGSVITCDGGYTAVLDWN